MSGFKRCAESSHIILVVDARIVVSVHKERCRAIHRVEAIEYFLVIDPWTIVPGIPKSMFT